jgi:hypothetical protein
VWGVAHILRDLQPDHPVIELIVRGALNDPDVLGVVESSMRLQYETGIGDALVDCTEMTHELTNVQIIDLATHLASLGVPPVWRQAIVKPHDPYTAVAVGLWEAACNNRGLTVKVFPTREAALEWLLTT